MKQSKVFVLTENEQVHVYGWIQVISKLGVTKFILRYCFFVEMLITSGEKSYSESVISAI